MIITQPLKNPGFAAVASFFFAGLGQIYNGNILKGFILIVVQVFNVLLICSLIGLIFGIILYPIVWAYGIYDAYKSAEKYNINISQN